MQQHNAVVDKFKPRHTSGDTHTLLTMVFYCGLSAAFQP